jgi:hypothetical protein
MNTALLIMFFRSFGVGSDEADGDPLDAAFGRQSFGTRISQRSTGTRVDTKLDYPEQDSIEQ